MTNDHTLGVELSGLESRGAGCLLGGLFGDALGAATEGLEIEELEALHGWVEQLPDGAGGTDDSFLRDMLANVLIDTHGYARVADWGRQWSGQAEAILRGPLRGRFFVSILQTTEKLRLGHDPNLVASGNLPSSTAAMAIAPVGIVNVGNPREAARQGWELASLVHPAEVAFCREGAAIIAAAIAAAMPGQASTREVLAESVQSLWATPESTEMSRLVERALAMADESQSFASFRAAFRQELRRPLQCDARETVPAAVAIVALARGDTADAVKFAANFGRDTDTIGSMAGSLCGALQGYAGLPGTWLGALAPGTELAQVALARGLLASHAMKSEREMSAWMSGRQRDVGLRQGKGSG